MIDKARPETRSSLCVVYGDFSHYSCDLLRIPISFLKLPPLFPFLVKDQALFLALVPAEQMESA